MNSKDKSKKKTKKRQGNFIYDFVKVTGAIPALCWMRPKTVYISKTAKKGVKGGVLIASNHISFTDPGLVHCVFWNRLKEEKTVVIFPEGTVNRGEEELQSYKTGVILMAHISQKPILPMYIAKINRWYNRRVVVIGEPIDVREMCGKIPSMEEIEKAGAYLREKELELMHYYQAHYQKEIQHD